MRDGIVTGTDVRTEWLLPWWYFNLRKANQQPISFADFGMTTLALEWCGKRGPILDLTDTGFAGWYNKPLVILAAPYERILWLDVDAEVLGDISPLFGYADKYPLSAAMDGHNRKDFAKRPVNTGVLVAQRGARIVLDWSLAIAANPTARRSDQEHLNAFPAETHDQIGRLPKEFNWLRMDGAPPGRVVIRHLTGPAGKTTLRGKVRNVDGFYGASEQ